jgi:hypothetical protein
MPTEWKDEMDRRLRDERESEAWAAAAADSDFQAEVADIADAYDAADAETWPQ